MQTAEEYEAQAAECVRLARSVNYEASKALLLQMAQDWVTLAQSVREKEKKE